MHCFCIVLLQGILKSLRHINHVFSQPTNVHVRRHLTLTLVSTEWNSGTGQTGPPCTHFDRNAVSRRLISCHYKVVSQRLKNSSKVHTTGLYSF